MQRREFATLGLSAAAIAAMSQVGRAQQAAKSGDHEHRGYHESFMKCAEACSDCARECERCAMHCAHMLGQGHETHMRTLQTCQDCADICVTAANVMSRGGPFSVSICEACADACKRCGDACLQHKDDKRMKACADECRKCEEACRTMLRSAQKDDTKTR
jgi:hypothetical protein